VTVRIPVLSTCAAFAAAAALAQTPRPVQQSETTTATATIVAIDRANREVVLETENGENRTVKVGPEVQRFSALKVGDKVTARYTESYALAIAEPGSAPLVEEDPRVTRHEGDRPSGEIINKITARVTVKAIDTKTPAVTVAKSTGETVDLKVDNRDRLAKLKVGDQIDVMYTESLMLAVEPQK
jgi:Cu/Ag efflux protein CusF